MPSPAPQPVTLYYAPDNASLIVRILLEEAGIPYRTVLVDRSVNAQRSSAYLKLNPAGLIPVCVIQQQPVFETGAIVLSLADQHGMYSIPLSDARRPQFLTWLFFLSNSLHSDLRQRFYPDKYAGVDPRALKAFSSTTLARLTERFGIIDQAYKESFERNAGGIYLFGDEPTVVDYYLAVCYRWAQLYPLDDRDQFPASRFGAVASMATQLQLRPGVIRACAQEGIDGQFLTNPDYADPPEGVAL